ncbi:uncharacterized protein LOC114132846 isoform X1 [Aphis gossypii]|nr:uncharacterized protein LOC114132846 isoform X1 [Aphis gossypii]
MNHKEIFDFPSFNGEHPYIGILMVPWNYSPCVLVAASWCLTHSTPISTQYFRNISIQNPYKVIAGYTSTSHLHDSSKHQISLGIEAVFHPNPLVLFVLIKVIPEFRNSIFIDYKRLKFNATEPMNENCESSYWLQTKHSTYKDNFFYEYLLMNQIPCPYVLCHYSNSTACTINKVIKKNCISAMVVCNYHFMSFAEFEPEEGRSVLYHKITNEVIIWIKQYVL